MMLLVVQIFMLLTGLHALVTGRFKLREDRVIYGVPARLIGLFCMLPIPLAFCGGFVMGVSMAVQGQDPLDPSVRVTVKAIDAVSLVSSMLLAAFTMSIAAPWARRPGQCHDRQGDLMRSSLPAWTDQYSAPADAI